jgi:hexosaminidase
MLKKYSLFIWVTALLISFSSCTSKDEVVDVKIIPQPQEVKMGNANFELNSGATIYISDSEISREGDLLKSWINGKISKSKDADISLVINSEIEKEEGYSLTISEKGVRIEGQDAAGIFFGLQSLRQILPISIEKGEFKTAKLPYVGIKDSPRFSWRGLHLDVSRHFMPIDFVKKYIDYIAFHKMNVFHWHLVDGVGWRIEIKKYPKLTEWGAWRVVKSDKPWIDFEVWKEGDTREKEGGFYTQEEIKEIVAYAADRHITVLPEIELPGHSEVVFQCYPEMLCTSKGKSLDNIGVYCAGNKDSYTFLEDILDEVIKLFPSEYIHIGGDEVNKANWEKCSKCKITMKNNHLENTDELQSYFINHFDKFLQSKGRKLIGWHEILEGKLSKNATIMYWGGIDGVEDVLKKGHKTVLSTGSHLYFDHYQSMSKYEPKAFGGFSSLTKVYNYEPVEDSLSSELKNNVLGVQANIWTEYMKKPENVEYMVFPRIAALSEIAWTNPNNKDFDGFVERLTFLEKRYNALGINVSKSAYRPQIEVFFDTISKQSLLNFEIEMKAQIFYTLDGSEPTINSEKYKGKPIVLSKSSRIKAITVVDGKIMTEIETLDAIIHKAAGKKIDLISKPNIDYSANGSSSLVDLELGGDKWGNGKWLGILDKDFECIIDLENNDVINEVGFSCIQETGAGIYFPVSIEVFGSNDENSFEKIGSWNNELKESSKTESQIFYISCNRKDYRYVKIKAKSLATEINKRGVFIFIDELIIQ